LQFRRSIISRGAVLLECFFKHQSGITTIVRRDMQNYLTKERFQGELTVFAVFFIH
jgi:hypothetical protein